MSFIDQLYYMDACIPALRWLKRSPPKTQTNEW